MIQKMDTRTLLAQSLLELSRRKSVENITVAEITKNCSLSRESFYYHFRDKYDLIAWFYADSADRIMSRYTAEKPWAVSLAEFLRLMQDHLYFFGNAIVDKNLNAFHDSLYQYTIDAMGKSIQQRYSCSELSEDIVFQLRFYAHGAVNTATEWLLSKNPESAEIIGQRISDSMSPILKTLFP